MFTVSCLVIAALQLPAPADTVQRTIVEPSGSPELSLVEEWRVGSVSGEDHELFGRIRDVAAGPNGVYVLDSQGPRILEFSLDGTFVRSLGGVGQGPGEYQVVYGIEVTGDGGVFAQDLLKVIEFRPDGTYAGERPVRIPTSFGSVANLIVTDDRRVFVLSRLADDTRAWLELADDGTPVDTVRVPAVERLGPSFHIGGAPAFAIETHAVLKPDGRLAWMRGDRFEIFDEPADGTLVRLIRDWERVPVGREERAEWQEHADYIRSSGNPLVDPDDEWTIPTMKPVVRSFWTDQDGRFWIRRHVAAIKRDPPERDPADPRPPPLSWVEPRSYDVVEPSGRLLGTVRLKVGQSPATATGDRLLVTTRGPLGVPVLIQYRLSGG